MPSAPDTVVEATELSPADVPIFSVVLPAGPTQCFFSSIEPQLLTLPSARSFSVASVESD